MIVIVGLDLKDKDSSQDSTIEIRLINICLQILKQFSMPFEGSTNMLKRRFNFHCTVFLFYKAT